MSRAIRLSNPSKMILSQERLRARSNEWYKIGREDKIGTKLEGILHGDSVQLMETVQVVKSTLRATVITLKSRTKARSVFPRSFLLVGGRPLSFSITARFPSTQTE